MRPNKGAKRSTLRQKRTRGIKRRRCGKGTRRCGKKIRGGNDEALKRAVGNLLNPGTHFQTVIDNNPSNENENENKNENEPNSSIEEFITGAQRLRKLINTVIIVSTDASNDAKKDAFLRASNQTETLSHVNHIELFHKTAELINDNMRDASSDLEILQNDQYIQNFNKLVEEVNNAINSTNARIDELSKALDPDGKIQEEIDKTRKLI